MSSSIDAFDLPIQFFAVGTALGMMSALIRYHRTGELDLWPVFVAYPALAGFAGGLLVTLLTAIL
jgi:hypothetical protein